MTIAKRCEPKYSPKTLIKNHLHIFNPFLSPHKHIDFKHFKEGFIGEGAKLRRGLKREFTVISNQNTNVA